MTPRITRRKCPYCLRDYRGTGEGAATHLHFPVPLTRDLSQAAAEAARKRRARITVSDPNAPAGGQPRCPICQTRDGLVSWGRGVVCENPVCMYTRAKARADALKESV